jgi:hypothetical protein
VAGKNLAFGLALLGGVVSLAGAESETHLVLWDTSVNARGALGYKDNVLLSKAGRQGSAFWQSALDLLLLRASTAENAGTFTFFASGEDRRYFSAPEVRKEQLVLSQAKWEMPLFSAWEGGGLAQYMYADQVFDASATEELRETIPVKSHNIQVAPFVSRQLPGASQLELKLNFERQLFNEPLDDYWEVGPQLAFTKRYGHRSEAALSYTFDHRAYDRRRQFGLDARSIPDTSLRFDQHEFEGSITHAWDEGRHWRSRFRFVFEMNDDNGPGYYDYHRYRWSKRIGYYGVDWQTTIEAKILHYDYARQPASDGAGIRKVWEYVVGIRGEKTVWKKLRVFAESEHEVVKSNYALEEYKVNTVLAGVDWEF